jgi:zinc/manganese transport system ATP-binding protein
MTAAITLTDLTVSYRRHPAVHHLSGCFASGSLTALAGPNGAGKSTLLKSILGLQPIERGSVTLNVPRSRIAYLPQQSEIDRSFPISVLDCVLLGHWQRIGLHAGVPKISRQQALAALQAVGLDGFAPRPLGSLSVGQFQRVLFARILLQDADLILLDEPFNAVDTHTTDALMQLIGQWHTEGRTTIAVLHDFEQVRDYFPRTLLLARRLIAWGTTNEALSPENLRAARETSAAWDENAPICTVPSQE